MNSPINFRSNLRLLKKWRKLSLTKFSEEAHIPRSTMQSILEGGQTSLDTACRISHCLQIPLSLLTQGILTSAETDLLHEMMKVLSWYNDLPALEQKKAKQGLNILLDVLSK